MFSVQGRTRENLVIKPRFLLYTICYVIFIPKHHYDLFYSLDIYGIQEQLS